MKVALIFRSKERNEFSIETLFESMNTYLGKNFEVTNYFLPVGRYNKLSSLKENITFVKKIRSDIYHITGEVDFVALALCGKKTIITVHDYIDLETMTGIKKILHWLFWRVLPYRKCKYIACVSYKTYKETVRKFPFTSKKVVYIPNPIDDKFVKEERNFNELTPRILVVGTRENKNLERIIEAVKGLSCELHIIGVLNENQRKLLEEFAINYINSFRISDEEMRLAYCNCDLLCFPSTYEGFGRPIIEANAVGRVVITSNIEPMVEVANDAAILVDPYSVNSIREGIFVAISDKNLRDNLIRKGYENAEKYRAASVADMYCKLYHEMIK